MTYSIIIPVYNRPLEIEELLESLTQLEGAVSFEVLVVEDGSPNTCQDIVKKFEEKLNVHYFLTENQGAGRSRNYGMQQAIGDYFVIFDSDCIIPPTYLSALDKALKNNFTDAYGGPDAAHENFTNIQKAINYSMTSIFTTGGIRGNKRAVGKFQPRSFNLGLSKKAFEITQGFSDLKIGEDIDLTFRLWENGFETQLIEPAFVYHKRRSTFGQFYRQTRAFGKARPSLSKRFPGTESWTYWFPSLFSLGLLLALFIFAIGTPLGLLMYGMYYAILFAHSSALNKSLRVGALSLMSTTIQFFGYGFGFLTSHFSRRKSSVFLFN
jgi:glycosyltransferase involved in cell wall biosynthesis